ncbi:caspase family protein [Ruegeria sp. HKCCD8929]|uniref:caspase family protein n=1 Tax=Ruegeria sp. HKCCD8929 TaxID=2683006 RepID=UPI001487F727|nr:caspase family protein [Ruegeria sp. HKCCD8929]
MRSLRLPFMPIHILFWLLILSLAAMPALASGRVALLIGNSAYDAPDMALRNPVNDVTALAEALRELGFAVTETTDQDAAAMTRALEQFGSAAQGAEMAVFFYAGHGVQIGGENHLIGTDFAGSDLGALRRSSVTMGRVRDVIARAGPEIGILLLDACRNNPFSERGMVEQGLVRARGGAGLLIAYATDPGNVAYDGIGENSIFTTGLLEHIATPGLDVRLMLGRVRQQVVLDTDGRQVPWVEESVLDEHSFAPTLPTSAPQDETAAELALWRDIASSSDASDFESYLRSYPEGLFAPFARDRIERLASRTAPAAAPVAATLAAAEPDKLAAALVALGLLSDGPARDLGPALEGYRRWLPANETATAERLYQDAAQVSVFLAATTLQRLRTDIVALRSVERTLTVAEDALGQIEEIVRSNPDALPVLQQARNDIYDIHRSRGVILRRLDQSRSYYDELLGRAVVFFPPDASKVLVGGETRVRDLDHAGAQLTENAALFLRHVAQADDSKKGSYQWLADLIPPG